MSSEIELKSCPFCGGDAEYREADIAYGNYIVCCQNCSCFLDLDKDFHAPEDCEDQEFDHINKVALATQWNTRQPAQATQPIADTRGEFLPLIKDMLAVCRSAEHSFIEAQRKASYEVKPLSDCRDVIKRAEKALTQPPDKAIQEGWRTMDHPDLEQIKKDGTKVLITNGRWVHDARWSEECQHGQFEEKPGWQIYECEDAFYSVAAIADEVTRWMPLPAPPITAAKKERNDG